MPLRPCKQLSDPMKTLAAAELHTMVLVLPSVPSTTETYDCEQEQQKLSWSL